MLMNTSEHKIKSLRYFILFEKKK